MAGTTSIDLDVAGVVANGGVGEQGHSGEYGPYPFNPHTAFQSLTPKVEEVQDQEGSVSPIDLGFQPLAGHSDEKEAIPESLVGNSEVLNVEIAPRDSYYNLIDSRFQQPTGAQTPQIYVDTGNNNQYLHPHDSFDRQEPDRYDDEPISPLRRGGDSLRRLLSRRSNSVSSFGSSRNSSLRTRPSLRSQPSTRSSLSSRWSFRRSQRIRPRDLEEGEDATEDMEPVELEGIAHNIGPFELYSLSREERRDLLSRNSQPTQQNMIPPHRLIIETLFGNQLCSPQYLGLRRVYMAQIDHKLKTALYESAVANPNPAVWPKPFAYLVGFLGILSQQLTPSASVTTFILSHMNDFAAMIRNGNFSAPQMQDGTSDGEKAAMAIAMGFNDPDNYTPWHQKIVHEWMLFSLEAWTMLNLSRSIECRTNLTASQTFCESTIEELIKPHLPAHALPAYTVAGVSPVSITPSEVTASMLHDWKGVTFKWTTDITEHLRLDSHDKVVKLYANVAFCHLHSIAKEKSSLYKAGFVRHHSLLAEISESYRLLFGSDRRSQTYFLELEASNPCNGFFNIFTLPNCDYEPRFLYSVTNDFPVFGDRLLVLKKLCVPTGILGLWRDKRDSLQWYTFWAVVFLGCFGAIMAFLQLGLTAIQTWATVAAMNPKPN